LSNKQHKTVSWAANSELGHNSNSSSYLQRQLNSTQFNSWAKSRQIS